MLGTAGMKARDRPLKRPKISFPTSTVGMGVAAATTPSSAPPAIDDGVLGGDQQGEGALAVPAASDAQDAASGVSIDVDGVVDAAVSELPGDRVDVAGEPIAEKAASGVESALGKSGVAGAQVPDVDGQVWGGGALTRTLSEGATQVRCQATPWSSSTREPVVAMNLSGVLRRRRRAGSMLGACPSISCGLAARRRLRTTSPACSVP